MFRIALIDDEVNDTLCKSRIEKYVLVQGRPICQAQNYMTSVSHATACSMILEQCSSDFEIVNYIIQPQNGSANIQDFSQALWACLEMDIDIVCLSVGSVKLSDSLYLNKVIDQLNKRQITVLSALSNNEMLTLPTCYESVIGVRCDKHYIMDPYEIRRLESDMLGVQVVANCSFKYDDRDCAGYNSYATPVVAAYLCEYWKEHRKGDMRFFDELQHYTPQHYSNVPAKTLHIGIAGAFDINCLKELMRFLAEKCGIESLCISDEFLDHDVRFKRIHTQEIVSTIKFWEGHAQVDVIFCIGKNSDNLDVFIYMGQEIMLQRRDVREVFSRELGLEQVCSNISNYFE